MLQKKLPLLLCALLCLLPFWGGGPSRADIPLAREYKSIPVVPQNGRRVALVVGCNYSGEQELQYALRYAQSDAFEVAEVLKGLGWEVERITETDTKTLRAALKRLSSRLDKNSVGLFYFSGHGYSYGGATYVVPSNALEQKDAGGRFASLISETEIVGAMTEANSRIVLLDVPRNSAAGSATFERLSLPPPLPPNTLVAYSTTVCTPSWETPDFHHSFYTYRLLTGIRDDPKATFIKILERIAPAVSADVKKDKNQEQVPEFRHNLKTDFLVAASKNPVPSPVRPIEVGQKWALLIGVEQYESDSIRALNFTLRDVAALKNTLPLTGFAPEHILTMTSDLPNKNINYPTNTNILKRLKTLKNQLGDDDTLLIYFSGHGFQEQEGGQNFLGSVNADVSDSALLKKTTISLEELRESLQGLSASQLILIMDCCRNNPFKKDGSKGGTDTNARTQSFSRDLSLVSDSVGKKTGTAILYACQEGQRSWEDPGKQQGAFTVFLLEALTGRATRNGTLTITDLAGYVEKRMKEWCIQNGKDQRPDYEQHNRANIVLQEGPATPN